MSLDPISTLQNFYQVYQTIKTKIETIKSNRNELEIISSRCEAVLETIERFKATKDQELWKYEKNLTLFDQCLSSINEFLSLPRFDPKKSTYILEQINIVRNAENDKQQLIVFHEQLSRVLGDFQVALSVNAPKGEFLIEEITRRMNENFQLQLMKLIRVLGKEEDFNTGSSSKQKEMIRSLIERSEANAELIIQVHEADQEGAEENPIIPTIDLSATGKRTKEQRKQRFDAMTLTPVSMKALQWDRHRSPKLGNGRYGIVFTAKYNNEAVALKYFKDVADGLDEKTFRSIRREAIILQTLDHPNIVKFIAASLEKGYLILELGKCSLEDVLHKGHSLLPGDLSKRLNPPVFSRRWCYEVLHDIARGLRYLHAQNIIHRDMKPGNVLLFVGEGFRTIAKISDFGVSKALDIVISTTKPQTNSIVGTTLYMAPELLDGTSLFGNEKVDTYAYGILCIETFTRERPWDQFQVEAQVRQAVFRRQRPNKEKWEKLIEDAFDREFLDVVGDADEGCLAQSPNDRSSAEDICALFEHYFPVKLSIESLSAADLSPETDPTPGINTSLPTKPSPESIMTGHKQDTYYWLCEHAPDVMREKLGEYIDRLYENDFTTVDRLVKFLPKKGVGWLEGLGFHPFDVEDILAAIKGAKPNQTKGSFSTALRPQGKEILAELLSLIPGLFPQNIDKYSSLLLEENIGTVERFEKRVEKDMKMVIKLLGSEIDVEEIKQFFITHRSKTGSNQSSANAIPVSLTLSLFGKQTNLTITNPSATTTSTGSALPLSDKKTQLKSELQTWLHQNAPDISWAALESYANILYDHEITSPERLVKYLPKKGAGWLKSQGFHEFDAEDVLAICNNNQVDSKTTQTSHENKRMNSILHGKEVFEYFFASVPGLSPQKVESYAMRMNQENIFTLSRLDRIAKERLEWFKGVIGSEIDVKEIVIALEKHQLGVEREKKVIKTKTKAKAQTVIPITGEEKTPIWLLKTKQKKELKDWILCYAPDIPRDKVEDYVNILYESEFSTVERMRDHLVGEKKPREEVEAWLRDHGFHRFDAEDLTEQLLLLKRHLLQEPAVRAQGRVVISGYLSSIKGLVESRVISFTEILLQENIHTVERLRRLAIEDPTWMKTILQSEIDAEDMMDYARQDDQKVKEAEKGQRAERLRDLTKDRERSEVEVLREFLHVGKETRMIRDGQGWTANHYLAYYRGWSYEGENEEETTASVCMCMPLISLACSSCTCYSLCCFSQRVMVEGSEKEVSCFDLCSIPAGSKAKNMHYNLIHSRSNNSASRSDLLRELSQSYQDPRLLLGLGVKELASIYSASDFKANGINVLDCRDAGFSQAEIELGGYSLSDFLSAGVINSDILANVPESKVCALFSLYGLSLLYRCQGAMSVEEFHEKCDKKGPTITLIETDEGYVFGGYTSQSWDDYSRYKRDDKAFLFTIKNPHNIPPTKYPVKPEYANEAISCYSFYGPNFNMNLYITEEGKVKSRFPYCYQDTTGQGEKTFIGREFYKEEDAITPKMIEVFSVE